MTTLSAKAHNSYVRKAVKQGRKDKNTEGVLLQVVMFPDLVTHAHNTTIHLTNGIKLFHIILFHTLYKVHTLLNLLIMIRNLRNKNVLRALSAVLMICCTTRAAFGQAVGDYGFTQTTVTGTQYLASTAANWVICVTAGTWTGATVAGAAAGGSTNAYIRTGTTCALSGSSSFKNLTIDNGGSLIAVLATTSGSPKGVRINGTALTINGAMGGTGNAGADGYLSIEPQIISGTITVSGAGTCLISRCRPSANTVTGVTLKLNMDITFTSANQVFSTNSANNTTIEVGTGKTATISAGYIGVGTSTGDPTTGTNFIINVYGTLNLATAAGNLNLANTLAFTTTVNVFKGATLAVGGKIIAPVTAATASAVVPYATTTTGAMTLYIEEGANVTATGVSDVAGATLQYVTATVGSTGAAITALASLTPVKNLTINNTGGVALAAATTVTGVLALTTGALTLGANNLVINGSVTKTSGSVDATAAPLSFTNTAAITLPASVYTGAVSSFTINGAGGVTLSSPLVVTNALTLTMGNLTLGVNDLTAGSFAGSPSTTSHVVTNGSGYLKSAFVGGDTKTFPVGATAGTYDPFTATPTSATTFGARVSTINPTHILSPTAIAGSREWDLTSTAPSSTVLAFTPGDGRAVPTMGVKLGHWNGTGWDADIAATYSSGTFTGTASTFSPYIATELAQPLSIDLQNFAVKGRGTTNVASWATASEKNNAAFNIERSADGQDFATIGTVKGNGTTTNVSNYTFTDNAPSNGVNYYRLRALDTDGKVTISKSVSIVNGTTTTGILKAYPSVSTAILTVDVVTEGIATLNIINIAGKTVLTKTIKDNGFSSNLMDVSGLSNGIYVLMFTSATGQSVQKFVKN